MAWYIRHPESSNRGEPQSVRDAHDALIAQKTAQQAEWEKFRAEHAEVEQEAEAE